MNVVTRDFKDRTFGWRGRTPNKNTATGRRKMKRSANRRNRRVYRYMIKNGDFDFIYLPLATSSEVV